MLIFKFVLSPREGVSGPGSMVKLRIRLCSVAYGELGRSIGLALRMPYLLDETSFC
jgi:hypothetical protein